MARHLRLSFEGATYHITARENRKERMFYSDKDKGIFLNKIQETSAMKEMLVEKIKKETNVKC